MEFIFYILVGLPILLINCFYSFYLHQIDYYSQWLYAYKKVYNKEPNLYKEFSRKEIKFINVYVINGMLLGFWILIGVFTQFYLYFLALSISNILSVYLGKKEYVNEHKGLRLFILYSSHTIRVCMIALIIFKYLIYN